MESQFILRLPEALRSVNPKECRLVKLSNKEVNFLVGAKAYPGIICKLPTIVESQRVVDNKLYKISDISTLVVVFEEKNFNVEEEIQRIESSGLTPPMQNARERMFAKTMVKTEEVEKIERQVAELLKADSKALKVEIVGNERDSVDTELELLAAEIENELIETGTQNNKSEIQEEMPTSEASGFKKTPDQQTENVDKDSVAEKVTTKPDTVRDEEILELEQKIREKQEQMDSTSNPIIKKRFEQALEGLKAEYERKRNSQPK